MMKKFLAAGAAILALCGSAHSATVSLNSGDELRLELNNLEGISFEFTLPENAPWYSNFGGYLKWSPRADGRLDPDGDWGTCYECGHSGGSWALASDGLLDKTVTVDFGAEMETVFVWIRATWGKGNVSYVDAQPISAVPLPAAGLLLVGAIAALGAARARKRTA